MQRRLKKLDTRVSQSLILVLLAAASLTDARAGEWKGFQNGGLPIVPDASYATRWSPESGITWQQPLAGYGQSTPVVMGNRIFVTSVSGDLKENLHVQVFDLKTGESLWNFDAKNSSPVKSTNYVSKAAPTPVCDGNGVIALFEGGNIVALSTDGTRRWERDLVTDYGPVESRHGLSSSLEQTEQLVFVWIERSEQPYVLALSKKTGETIWKADGLGVTSWSSPRLVPVGDASHLVLSGVGKLAGFDPSTGKRLWELDGISGNSTPTPVPLGGGRFLIGATVGRGESGGGNAAESNGVIQISGTPASGFAADYVWRASAATSSFGSPIAHNGLAWFVNREGVLYCLDVKTGDEKYARRTASSIWSTPLVIGDRLYLFGKDGTTTILNASVDFEVQAENTLWAAEPAGGQSELFGESVLYAAAAADSTLILRRGDRLFAIRP
jgi:outer membrane protein assembly factor BamB